MATFKAIVLKHHIKSDNTVNIKIRVTHNRQSKIINTGIVATLSDLTRSVKKVLNENNQTEQIITYKLKTQAFIDATEAKIKKYRDKCNKFPDKVLAMNCEQLYAFLTESEIDPDFITYGISHIEKLQKAGRIRTAQDYQTALNTVKRFIGSDHLPVSQITVKFLESFVNFIIANPVNAKKNTTMSRAPSHYLSSIRALHNAMKNDMNDEENGVLTVPFSPFIKFKMPKPPITKKRAISSEIIKKIYNLPDETITNSSGSNRFNIAKDCFILSFCLLGMNSADLYDCTEINETSIVYKRKKTRNRRQDKAEILINIQPEIKQLIEKYRDPSGTRVFNFYQHYSDESTFNAAINKGLKQIGSLEEIKIEKLEFYSARHSWATIALNDVHIDKYTVHSGLNHVDEEMKVTEIYLKKDWSLINLANRKVLDFVFKVTPPAGILTDYKNIFKAINNDKTAISEIELKYGKIKNTGQLFKLGSKLFDELTPDEKNMIAVNN